MYSSTEQDKACHHGTGPAGYYGAETSDCDSPVSLLNETFKWIKMNLRDEIDFVVWTGDSARHDNDERIPRSRQQVVSQNEMLVTRFLDVFGKPENYDDDDPTNDFAIPIIPTFGNNDVLPHNIFEDGPNTWTKEYLRIWRQFIPEAQRHQFQQGGWFFVEVIPNTLAVVSLNTLYFFDSNSAVDGCAAKSEPGYEHMEWLRIQLELLRQRGMKAILIGHVPPARVDSKTSWDETCWQKYALWQKQYRDVILTSLYGHMNIDHFVLQDFKDIKKHVKKGLAIPVATKSWEDGELTAQAASDYLEDLRSAFSQIPNVVRSVKPHRIQSLSWLQSVLSLFKKSPKKDPLSAIGGEYGERYSLSLISSSIVPNFFPSLRVYEYNLTGLESITTPEHRLPCDSDAAPAKNPDISSEHGKKRKNYKDKSLKKPKRHKFIVPKPPSKSSPPGPAYSPQTLTLLGYKHYYANLTHINHDFPSGNHEGETVNTTGWKEGKHHGRVPQQDKPHPKPFAFAVEYSTFDDEVYKLEDLTVRSYLRLAHRIARPEGNAAADSGDGEVGRDSVGDVDAAKKGQGKYADNKKKKKKTKKMNKVWFTFVRRAFIGTMEPDDIKERFGGAADAAEEAEGSLEL